MADRILAVNAYTTFTLLDGEIEGHGWQADAPGVLNATSVDGDSGGDSGDGDDASDGRVVLELELDNTATDDVPAHADRLSLSPAAARELASELESYADRAED
jgi:hypothetical protein